VEASEARVRSVRRSDGELDAWWSYKCI
jgi:hypothetical protein